MLFDQDYYIDINEARWAAIAPLVERAADHGWRSCLDVGCGPGWFSAKLTAIPGLSVRGVDGRAEIAEEAARRVPEARFAQADFEDQVAMASVAPADLVFCFGLLYHLENPFQAVRTLRQLTSRVLCLETMVIPGEAPLAWLVNEGRNETQGLSYMALIPSLPALTKMLFCAGFRHVYRFRGEVNHADFNVTRDRHARRAMMVAAYEPLSAPDLEEVVEPDTPKYDYAIKA